MREIVDNQYDEEVSEEQLAWAEIKEAQKLKKVMYAMAMGLETLSMKGGLKEEFLKLRYKGIYGYLPKSKIDNYEFRGLHHFLGKEFEFVVDSVDYEGQWFVADRIQALEISSRRFWKTAKEGQIYEAFIRGVDAFNLFLLVEGVPTVLNKRDVSYSFIENLSEEFDVGELIKVKVLSIEQPAEDKKGSIRVSSKILEKDPWTNIVNYHERCSYIGKITKIHPEFGVFIELEPGLSVRTNFPPGATKADLIKGKIISVRILDIDAVGRRINAISIIPKKNIKSRNAGSVRSVAR